MTLAATTAAAVMAAAPATVGPDEPSGAAPPTAAPSLMAVLAARTSIRWPGTSSCAAWEPHRRRDEPRRWSTQHAVVEPDVGQLLVSPKWARQLAPDHRSQVGHDAVRDRRGRQADRAQVCCRQHLTRREVACGHHHGRGDGRIRRQPRDRDGEANGDHPGTEQAAVPPHADPDFAPHVVGVALRGTKRRRVAKRWRCWPKWHPRECGAGVAPSPSHGVVSSRCLLMAVS